MTRRQGPRCCGKVRFATQEAAETALRRIQNLAEGRHPVRVYRCPNGWGTRILVLAGTRAAIDPRGGEPEWTHSPLEGIRSMPRRGETMPPEQRQKIADANRLTETPASKKCPSCGEVKPACDFGRRSKNPILLRSYCLPCERAKARRPARPAVSIIDRFMAKVDKPSDADGCWHWTAATNSKGYGKFTIRHGVFVYAHRWAYEHFVGPIPDGLSLDHLCHGADPACERGDACPHRSCVNPTHLEPVTNRENLRRGRRWNRPTTSQSLNVKESA